MMKAKLITCLCIMISGLSIAQEQDSWWQSDGSLKVENAEHTFTSPIVQSRDKIKEDEMVLVNLNNYRGIDKADIHYGIYSKDLSSDESTELRVYHRKKITLSNPDVAPNFGFDFTNDNYLIYGCKTETNTHSSFTNQEDSWNAYGYYATGHDFSKTQIKSTDYKHLLNRPKSATWWDTFSDITIGTLVVVFLVASLVFTGGLLTAALGGSVAGVTISVSAVTIGVAASLSSLSFVALKSVYDTRGYLLDGVDTHGYEYLIPPNEFVSNMELVVPKKIDNPKDDQQKNWNKSVDAYLVNSFECSDLPGKRCYKAPFKEVVAKMSVKNSHVKHVNFPGVLEKNITPYRLFKNYRYITDETGSIIAGSIKQEDIKDASEIFDSKVQILPRKLVNSTQKKTVSITFKDYQGIPTYYMVSKDAPAFDTSYYSDLGVYGQKDGIEYRLYRFQINVDEGPISITTGPEGPFLVGDNIQEKPIDLTVSVYRFDDVNPFKEVDYSFKDSSEQQINFNAGDSVVFKSKHADFSLQGIPEIWLARAAGESKYYCTPSIKADEYKPFLGFDSQVHGVAVRKHPTPNKRKTPKIVYDKNTGLYSWYWIAQRRMDPTIVDNSQLANQNVTFSKFKRAKDLGNPGGFPIGGGVKIQEQRNNQREGYNMQLLYAWKTAGQSTPVFEEYGGADYILGTDPDEIVYLGSNGAKIPSGNDDIPIPQALLKINIEEWKRLPEGVATDPINEMVTAYQKNRSYVDSIKSVVSDYNGYEILDKGMYREASIPGVSDTKPCNGKPCVKFFKDGIGVDDDNNKAPGNFTLNIPNQTPLNIPVSLSSPQKIDSGFYGSIEGDQWPSEWQKNVPYSFTGLSGLSSQVLNTLVMEYSHENELGILTKDTRYFRDGGKLSKDGKWTEKFNLKGWGYNEITVYVQRKPNATMVPIAGMELLEVMVRFFSAPGSKWKDFSPTAFEGIDIKDGRGEGNYWYLRDANTDVSNSPKYGRPLDDINKSYTFSRGDRVVFTVMDSDPHTFFHYDVEWYLSERFMAKRLMPDDLEKRIQWFWAPVDYEGLGEFIHKGRWLDKTFDTPGKYRLTAVYGDNFDKNNDHYGHTRMSHEITVMGNDYNKAIQVDKGLINIHPLSPDQISWLKEKNPKVDDSWKVAEVDDIFSLWTHVNGPRAEPPNDKPNRYGLENDYNAHFKWFENIYTPDGLVQTTPIKGLTINDTNLEWFPMNWIRHYSGNELPNDMDVKLVKGGITSTVDGIDAALKIAFPKDTPEPWQWRLPWVSLTNWQGYRTRANIKVVFNMKKLFDNQTGAFAGVGVQNKTDEEYIASVSNPIPKLTDLRKSKYDFYLDLLSGRKLVYDFKTSNPATFGVYQVDDIAKTNNVVLVNSFNTHSAIDDYIEGADMSIVKNLEDEGITWIKNGTPKDPYQILQEAGATIARFRLWINPKRAFDNKTPYNYSNLVSVTNEIIRAKKNNLKVLLDLHYSDTWTDPKQNIISDTWKLPPPSRPIDRLLELENHISNYTKSVLGHLKNNGALPDIIQIGNEINGNILLTKPYDKLTLHEIADEIGVSPEKMNGNKHTINWDRNARLLNAGLSTVDQYFPSVKTMLHIAGPVSAQYWLNQAFNRNAPERLGSAIVNKELVDIIGFSYYLGEPGQQQSISTVKQLIQSIGSLYNKDVLIVETAFPHTYGYSDGTTNLYGESTRGSWPESTGVLEQLEWLVTLKETLKTTPHSIGFVYWEPFWVGSNTANTKDFIGSNWENMSFFSFQNGIPTSENHLDLIGGINVFSLGTKDGFLPLECFEEKEYPYHTSFETDFGGWSHFQPNDVVWSRHSGATPNPDTGPTSAKNGNFYLYTESSSPDGTSKNAILESPCYDLRKVNSRNSLVFNFYYHMYGSGVGELNLEITTDSNKWETLWTEHGNQGNNWLSASVDLSSYHGRYIKLRFNATTGANSKGDIAIDQIYLIEQTPSSFRNSDATKENLLSSEEFSNNLNDNEFQVYPNPSSEELTLSFPNTKSKTIELFDVQGRLLYKREVKAKKSFISNKNLGISSGILFIRMTPEKGTSSIKKVIIK